MNLREFVCLGKLPAPHRLRVLVYSWRKLFGLTRTARQTEANRLLRFLASASAVVTGSNQDRILMNVRLFMSTVVVQARSYPSSDLGILYQVLGKEEYSPVVDLAKKLRMSGALRILDAGANVGYATLYFHAAFPQATIAALEIDQNNALQIRKHLESNGLTTVQLWENALWSRNANLRIRRDFRDQTECSFYVEETLEAPEVIGRSLREICDQMQWTAVDILKIDIEGGERYLFETDELADELLRSTRILAIEIHDEFQIRQSVLRHLTRNGFSHLDHGDLTIAYKPLDETNDI